MPGILLGEIPGLSLVISSLSLKPLVDSASVDNIRLWNVAENAEDSWSKPKSAVPFKIIPGHHGAYVSQMRAYLAMPLSLVLTKYVTSY